LNLNIALTKGKKSKEWRLNWKKIKQQKIWLKDENERKKNFNKRAKKKRDWNEIKKHMKNYNWRTKLKEIKRNKTFISIYYTYIITKNATKRSYT